MLSPSFRRNPRSDPPIEQQVCTPIIPIRTAEHVLCSDIRNELVVNPDPGCARTIVHIPVRVQDVKGVVAS